MWVDIAYLNAFEAKIGALKPPLHNVGFCNLFLGPKNDKRPFEILGLYNGVALVPKTETGRIMDRAATANYSPAKPNILPQFF